MIIIATTAAVATTSPIVTNDNTPESFNLRLRITRPWLPLRLTTTNSTLPTPPSTTTCNKKKHSPSFLSLQVVMIQLFYCNRSSVAATTLHTAAVSTFLSARTQISQIQRFVLLHKHKYHKSKDLYYYTNTNITNPKICISTQTQISHIQRFVLPHKHKYHQSKDLHFYTNTNITNPKICITKQTQISLILLLLMLLQRLSIIPLQTPLRRPLLLLLPCLLISLMVLNYHDSSSHHQHFYCHYRYY